jgi:hypothetical protein
MSSPLDSSEPAFSKYFIHKPTQPCLQAASGGVVVNARIILMAKSTFSQLLSDISMLSEEQSLGAKPDIVLLSFSLTPKWRFGRVRP